MSNNDMSEADCPSLTISGESGFATSTGGCAGSVFRAAFFASRSIMYLIDPINGEIVDANPAACAFYGYKHEDVQHLPLTSVSLLGQGRILDLLANITKAGAVQFTTRHKLKNGQVRDMELDATPITLANGRRCIFFVGHDITARIQAENALRERESLLRAILDSAGEGIGFKDIQHVYREANPAFCAMLGAPCASILGRKSEEFFDPETNAKHLRTDEQVLRNRASVVYEVAYPGENGGRLLSINKTPVVDSEGHCLGVVFINHDITQLRRAEEALRQSEGMLRAIIHSALDTICVMGADECFREANQTFCDLVGFARDEVLGAPLSKVFGPEELHIQRASNAMAREAGQPVHFEQRYTLPPQPARDGHGPRPERQVWFSVVKTAVLDKAGNFLGVLGMGRDVTAQKQAELALRESERRFSSLVRQSPVGVFEADATGQLIFANERMQRQTGRSQEQLSGEGWLSCIHADDYSAFEAAWRKALAGGKDLDSEVRLRAPRGGMLWALCHIRPLRDAQNGLMGYLGTFTDISDRRQAEILRDDIENVVRHDLKSPLGAMQSASELLSLLGPLNAEQAQVLGEMRGLVSRMLGLIMLSLDLASMESGLYVPSTQALDLREVLEGMEKELRPLVSAKGLALTVSPGAEAGPFPVLGERRLLDSVFSNLLKNAAEASPEGDVIEVRLWVDSRQGSSLAMASVRNAGEVQESIRRRFFDKFATAGKKGGTGLGTYSARLMLRTLGGTLALDTTEPGHTTLTVRLPRPGESKDSGASKDFGEGPAAGA